MKRHAHQAARIGVGLAAWLAAGPLGAAWAQPSPPRADAASPGAPDAEAVRRIAHRVIADTLTWSALQSLRQTAAPGARAFELSAHSLAMASELRPDDAELARLELEAWDLAGNTARALEATRRLIRLDPRDTPAQLRLINDQLRRIQTADGRLKIYERLLFTEEGRRLDPGVRSRLALDAALLARETGDEARFLDLLSAAAALDRTNSDAAQLFATYFLDRSEDPEERVDVLINLVLAEPLDPQVLHNLAREFMRWGAFEAGLRWMNLTVQAEISRQTPRDAVTRAAPTIPDEMRFDQLLCLWHARGPLSCLGAIRGDDARVVARYDQAVQHERATGGDPDRVPPPRLAYNVEVVRLLIAAALREPEGVRQALDERILGWVEDAEREQRRLLDEFPEAAAQQGVTEEAIDAYVRQQAAHEVWLRLLSGFGVESAAAQIEQLKAAPESYRLDDDALQRFEGWLAVHRNRAAEATALLEPLADDDPGARLALAQLAERDRRIDDAIAHYRAAFEMDQASAVAAFARTRIESLLDHPMDEPLLVERLNEKGVREAPWAEEMVADPRSFVRLEVRHAERQIDPLGRVELRIVLRNTGRAPLGVGESAPINSRIMLSPGLKLRGGNQNASFQPEVLRLNRRFSLAPGEEIEATLWGGRGALLPILDNALTDRINLRWRALQGFLLLGSGEYAAGPNCVSTQSDMLVRSPADLSSSASAHADRLMLARGLPLLGQVQGVCWRLFDLLTTDAPPEARQARVQQLEILRSALITRIESMTPDELAFTIFKLSRYKLLEGPLRQAVEAQLGDRAAPYERTIVLLSRLADDDADPDANLRLIDQIAASGSPAAAAFARQIRDDLAEMVERADAEPSSPAPAPPTPTTDGLPDDAAEPTAGTGQ